MVKKPPKGCRREGKGKFFRCRVEPKSKFDTRSFRTLVRGKNRIIIGCPRGQWSTKRKRCKVGTRAQAILKPVK